MNSSRWGLGAPVAGIVPFGWRVAAELQGEDEPQSGRVQDAGHNDTCIYYHELDADKQCAFIKGTEDCQLESGFINYLEFTLCAFAANLQPLSLIILLVWLSFLFVCLGVTAKNFFCPTLTTISKALKLSDNVAGVTLLAFGNGAPDVFSAIAAITHSKDGDAGLAIGALFGAAVFITTVVAGTVSALKSFEVAQVAFLRDAIFVVGASYWTFYVLYTGEIWTSEAVGFILLYVCYVCVVLIARKFEKPEIVSAVPVEDGRGSYQRLEEGAAVEPVATSDIDSPDEKPAVQDNLKPGPAENINEKTAENFPGASENKPNALETALEKTDEVCAESNPNLKDGEVGSPKEDEKHNRVDSAPAKREEIAGANPQKEPLRPERKTHSNFGTMDPVEAPRENQDGNRSHSTEINVEERPQEFTGGNSEEEPLLPKMKKPGGLGHQLRALFGAINPIDVEGWRSKSYIMRFFDIYQSPIKLLLQITVPLVLHDRCSWNKLLNCIQLLVGPVLCVFVTKSYDTAIADEFYLWHLMLGFGAILAIIALFTSKPNKPPVYYMVFAFLGFVISVCWIYAIANEIVNLLRMYGMVFDLSDAILGLTFLAWGNCIGDLVADTSMARQGAPKMAISACFGGPIFNMLIGIGVATTLATAQNGGIFKLKTNTLQFVLAAGLGASLFTSMFYMIAARFRATKVYAVLLYVFYAGFLVLAILTETEVIKW